MPQPISRNTLFYGDNLTILREHIPDQSVDLIYLDPPFNSNRNYNVLFKDDHGKQSEAQIQAFEDTWTWTDDASRLLLHMQRETDLGETMDALLKLVHRGPVGAYLVMMAGRLIELHRVLKPMGSLYLHCDPTASHYLKIILDAIFGPLNYRNEIVWRRYGRPKGSQHRSRRFAWSTDTILFYSKSEQFPFYEERIRIPVGEKDMERRNTHRDEKGPYYSGPILRSPSMGPRPNLVYEYKGYTPGPEGWRMIKAKLEELDAQGDLFWTASGIPRRKVRPQENPSQQIDNLWDDIEAIGSQAQERLGYPTQKPLALLDRIIQVSSNPGDIVLDPFCGCGTAVVAAETLGRRWVGIDITHLSIALQKYRLEDSFGLKPVRDYAVIGEPTDVSAARQLASDDRYQFQWWALSLVRARPLGGDTGSKTGKKGSDKGIDGIINFIDDGTGKPKRVIVQVKSGKVQSGLIRDLVGTVQREGAQIGVFVTLEEPTRDMLQEAATAGFYRSPGWGQNFPKLQILTIVDLLRGAEIKMPPAHGTFKQAQRAEQGPEAEQHGFDLDV